MSPKLLEVEKEHHIAFVTRPFGGDLVNAFEIAEADAAHFKEAEDPINVLTPDTELIVLKPVGYDFDGKDQEVKAAVLCEHSEAGNYPLHLEVMLDEEVATSRSLRSGFLQIALETIQETHPKDYAKGIWTEKPNDERQLSILSTLGFNAVKLEEGEEVLVKKAA
jgi:hypothetical protein